MKRLTGIFSFAIALTLISGCGEKHEDDSKKMAEDFNESKFDNTGMEDDMKFVIDAADGGLLEVKLGELAKTKAVMPEVKEHAQHMIDDHSKANEELKALAAQKNITLPQDLSEDHKKDFNDLNEKSGEDFDKAYVEFMVKDHKKDIDKFEEEYNKGKDEDIKKWASEKLPTLRHHLEMWENTKKMIK
jgi:putative membrane protein